MVAHALCGAIAAALVVGCDWLSLAEHALTYPTLQRGEVGNVVALDSLFIATAGEDGITVRGADGRVLATVLPPVGSESVDALAIEGSLLFTLDARPPGHLTAWSMDDPMHPRVVTPPRAVAVGPFSGVSAAAGIVVVSGGTSRLTAWAYDSAGALGVRFATADLGRGQPDVLLARDGRVAFVSTHNWGPYFELDVVPMTPDSARMLHPSSRVALPGAGFTDGGAKPANFPVRAALLDDGTLLVAAGRGVAVMDVSDAEHATIRRVMELSGPVVSIATHGKRAAIVVAGETPTLVVIDLMNATQPLVRRHPLAPGTLPLGVAMSARTVAIAARGQGVLVLHP